MPKPKAILFDVGNVLLRLKTDDFLKRVKAACPALGPEIMLAELRDPGSRHFAYERGEISGPDFHAHLQSQFGLGWSYSEWLWNWNDYFLPNRPMEVLIAKLQGQVEFWALSNTNAEHYIHFKREYRLFDSFKGVIGSHQWGLRKPDLALYKIAINATCLPAEEIFFIDDLEKNVSAARAAGMQAFHYEFNDLNLKAALKASGLDIPDWDRIPSNMAC